MKLALGLGGCHGDASPLPTPHRPSSSSRQPFWARKERSGVALCFSFFAGRGFSWEHFDAYLIQVFALGRGQRLTKKKKKKKIQEVFCLPCCVSWLFQAVIREKRKKNGIRVASMLSIFYHLWQGQQRNAFLFLPLTLHLMSSSYCWANLTTYWYHHQKISQLLIHGSE